VHLPESTAKLDPKETLVVVVNANEDHRRRPQGGRRRAARRCQGRPDPGAEGRARPRLVEARSRGAENAAKAHSLTIMGDKDIPYQLLRKVMYTAAVAEFTDVSFAVNRKE